MPINKSHTRVGQYELWRSSTGGIDGARRWENFRSQVWGAGAAGQTGGTLRGTGVDRAGFTDGRHDIRTGNGLRSVRRIMGGGQAGGRPRGKILRFGFPRCRDRPRPECDRGET